MATSAINLVHQVRVNSSLTKPPSICASPSEVFSATLPTNPSQTTTSAVPLKMSSPSTLPTKLRLARAQQFRGALDDVVALDHFFADVEQAHRGPLLLLERSNQRDAENRELKQVFRGAVDIGPEVEHRGHAAGAIGNHGRDRRAVDAVERLQHEARNGHQCPGVTGADGDVGAALLDQVHGQAHRRIALAAQGLRRRIVHGDHLVGMNHLQPGAHIGGADRGAPRSPAGGRPAEGATRAGGERIRARRGP